MQTPVPEYLQEVLNSLADDTSGSTADYIPELANANPNQFAMAVTTTEGSTYAAGDVDTEFTIQSISKPFAYAAAIMDRGLDRVLESVGVEPSGEAFNELSLETGTHRPKNPMINAGAITTHQLLIGEDASTDARFERIHHLFCTLAGRELSVDENVYASELETADRNLATAHMLRSYGVFTGDPHEIVAGYTRQCSILVNVTDLSVMAATLAHGGQHPYTNEQLIEPAVARQVMAVMAAAGMYDGAGDWLTRVGIPAKSGVAGGLVGVLPDQVGIAAFSPRLDAHGNSQRGRRVFERFSTEMGMHLFAPRAGRRNVVTVDNYTTREVFTLQGTIQFTAAAELLDLMAVSTADTAVHVDVTRVASITDVARRMILEGMRRMRLDGRHVALNDPLQALPRPDLGDGTFPEQL